ncbi:hypothetical protein Pcinc_010237 [Petrolisthes cinctipes]|uniref:DnaJ homolog subfamily C member 10 n=1 Tax=Petrolisthes cinctipes TaxID=88211 RepID=A0AAE1G5N4_PETCI|nr:hypothetical protein Pcinc_010237 [Petrolisthes cinctipes]
MLVRILFFGLLCSVVLAEDFYELLGVTKSASQKEIRKAFKEKALIHHPDKNTDDPNAHEKFVKISRAYEVLKDEELRKKYDLHGEGGLDDSSSGHQYHSWNYYHDNFGIYDDDPEIITLNTADFELSVTGTSDVWFINFYHPMCSHCHTLAPVWRRVARELVGVVRIGAVNCDDDYQLCSSQGIRSYPTLISYPGRHRYTQEKTHEHLVNYALHQVSSRPFRLTPTHLKQWEEGGQGGDKPCLLLLHSDSYQSEELWATRIKLSAILDGLAAVAYVECHRNPTICLTLDSDSGVQYFTEAKQIKSKPGTEMEGWEAQEIATQVMKLLPEMQLLDEEAYQNIRQLLDSERIRTSWLVQFRGQSDDDNFEIRKLPALLHSINLGRVECSTMQRQCDDLYIAKTPSFVLFKPGGGYEVHHGRLQAQDIAVFAREATSAPHFRILTPQEFPRVLAESSGQGSTWFVDFYAPWCPPCIKLLPEFRKASRLVDPPVNFGSIDCTLHQDLCSRFNIRQYPTTVLYNQSVPHEYMGFHTATEIVDFVKDTLNPIVVTLDPASFHQIVAKKPYGETLVVDYFANWCGPCREMAPEYRRFARTMTSVKGVKVASLDCAVHSEVCRQQGINSYPSVMLYPAGGHGTEKKIKFNGWSRDAASFRQWTYSFLPSQVAELDADSFSRILAAHDESWLVDFYAPWCGHCQVFAPDFEDVTLDLEGTVKTAKLNCERHRGACQRAGVRAYPTVLLYRPTNYPRQPSEGTSLPELDRYDIVERVKKWLGVRHKENKRLRDEF